MIITIHREKYFDGEQLTNEEREAVLKASKILLLMADALNKDDTLFHANGCIDKDTLENLSELLNDYGEGDSLPVEDKREWD